MKTTFLISLAAALSVPVSAQCLPEEGRFEKTMIDFQGTSYWVINDNKTELQWMMCPMGQQGEQCIGDAVQEKRLDLDGLIETFNQAEGDSELTWRLPHTQELITISDQSCRYGTYTDYFHLTETTEHLEQIYQAVAPFKEKMDILYQRHQDNLALLQKRREADSEVDAKMAEWLQKRRQLLNHDEWTLEAHHYVSQKLEPWLRENVPEWVNARTSYYKFWNSPHFGDKELGLESLNNFYSNHYSKVDQAYATQNGATISFRNVPKLEVASDSILSVGYDYSLRTIQSQQNWSIYYVRLVRAIPHENR
ncbi:DUF1566 domain-containing protein [Vibrio vulnificus]|nr:DUF1566 domain-containing protein [Vibrio vulnificus]EHH2487927.1 DUF1566 domain-containing protein [Vibrio vulnificus]EHU4933663.1 DUF1566 domain-containing protein [Vibrio vulnificus]EHV9587244.1 DUF1566 domain-containing protein [Vibrio vulnificus]EHZ2719714.1 DUF1566 domain-containing protein [Vibrio vulnificus]